MAPKAKENTQVNTDSGNMNKIAPKDDDYDFDKERIQKTEQPAPIKEAPKPKVEKPKPKNQGGFGGFAAGFLDSKPAKKTQAPKQKAEPEDLTHVKAKDKSEQLKIDEVQDAMKAKTGHFLEQSKDQWMTPEFFEKLAKNPKLLKAFQNPEYMQAL